MLFVLVCFLYVLSGLLLFIGLSTIAFTCDCLVGLAMVAMLTWAFIRYSGQYRSVGGAIDQAAGVILEQVKGLNSLGSGCGWDSGSCKGCLSALHISIYFHKRPQPKAKFVLTFCHPNFFYVTILNIGYNCFKLFETNITNLLIAFSNYPVIIFELSPMVF